MKQKFIFHAISVFITLGLGGLGLSAESAAQLIQKGNVYYDKLQPTEALGFYLPAEKLEPNNAALLVRIARQYRHLMSEAKSSEEKLRQGNVALEYAKRAVALAPNDAEAQLGLAISYGKVLPLLGSKQQMTYSQQVKIAADRVIVLDPGNDLAWHVLGRWYLNVADVGSFKRALAKAVYGELPVAKYEDAERCFLKAISLNPKRLMHYIELGSTYVQMDRPEEARKFISKGLAMTETEKDDPECKRLGREILKKL